MSEDRFTEVTSTSWGSRIGSSIKGILLGLVLFVAAAPLLFWNEGRAIKTAQALEDGAAAVVSVSPDKVDPAKDKKLVHVTGEALTEEVLSDSQFGVSLQAIKLSRDVEMYQWQESKESKSTRKAGGSEQTETTYTYKPVWSPQLLESAKFKKPDGHANPAAMSYRSSRETARKVTLGAFLLPQSLIEKISNDQPVKVADADLEKLPSGLKGRAKASDGIFYIPAASGGGSPESPAVGDVRVKFTAAKPGTVSIIAQQVGSTFEPYEAKNGRRIELLATGARSAQGMFQAEMASNRMLTWLIRLGGFLMMFIGLSLVFRPLAVAADVLPILGSLLRAGTGAIAFVLSLALSLVVIAIGWLAYRPVMGVGLLAAAAVLIVLGVMRAKAKGAKAAPK